MPVNIVSQGFLRQVNTNQANPGPVSVTAPANSLILVGVAVEGSIGTSAPGAFGGTSFTAGASISGLSGPTRGAQWWNCRVRMSRTATLDWTPDAGVTTGSGYYFVLSGARHVLPEGGTNANSGASATNYSSGNLLTTVTGSRYFGMFITCRNVTISSSEKVAGFIETGGGANFAGAFFARSTTGTAGMGPPFDASSSGGTSGSGEWSHTAVEIRPQIGPYPAMGWGVSI